METNAHLSLSNTQLKWIACLSMLVDHAGLLLFPHQVWLRVLGRLAFPIFAWSIAQGYHYTHDRRKYFLRLALTGLLFEPVYRYCMGISWNVLFTLTAGLAALWLWDVLMERSGSRLPGAVAVLAILLLSGYFGFDYGPYGVALILTAAWYRQDNRKLSLAWFGLNLLYTVDVLPLVSIQIYSLLAIPLLSLCNGQPGRGWRGAFYLFYCGHIPLLYLVGQFWDKLG